MNYFLIMLICCVAMKLSFANNKIFLLHNLNTINKTTVEQKPKKVMDVFSTHFELTVCPYTTLVGPRIEAGVKINRFLKLYIGGGIESLGKIHNLVYSYGIIYPYFKYEIEFLNKKHSPYFNISVGYSAAIPKKLREGCGGDCPDWEETLVMPVSNRRGGFLYDISLGYRFSIGKKHMSIAPGIKYNYREINYFLETKSIQGYYNNQHIVSAFNSYHKTFHYFSLCISFGLN